VIQEQAGFPTHTRKNVDEPWHRQTRTADSIDIRQGVVRRANGVNALVVWIEMSTTELLQVIIA
jgi:hypothetical protein